MDGLTTEFKRCWYALSQTKTITSDQVILNVFLSLNCLISLRVLGESDLFISFLKEAMEKLSNLNTFWVRKMLSSTCLIRSRFQG